MLDNLALLSPQRFPSLLTEIPQPPKQLYVRGELPPQDWQWLAVVGSRALSSYGKQACEHLIEGLRGYPIVIVSGLAYGADACAHETAMRVGLPTVACPGSGLDYSVMYPRMNLGMAKRIIEKGGAHVSEMEPLEKANTFTFPRRNRIMVGLTHATLVIEAKEKSGSLITARLATDYNRELLVVPGSIFSATSKGTHQFLKLGATPVTEPADILRALGIEARPAPVHGTGAGRADLNQHEIHCLEILATPRTRDDLITSLSLPVSEANVILSTMEIKGLIKEELGVVRIA